MLSSVPSASGTSSSSLDDAGDEARGVGEVELRRRAEVHLAGGGLLGDRDRRQAEDDALERGGDRPRVGDVVAEVGAVVDARDDERRRSKPSISPSVASRTQSTGVPSVA